MKELLWPVEETGLVAAVEWDREGVIIQRVGIDMAREVEPGTVMAQARGKGRGNRTNWEGLNVFSEIINQIERRIKR